MSIDKNSSFQYPSTRSCTNPGDLWGLHEPVPKRMLELQKRNDIAKETKSKHFVASIKEANEHADAFFRNGGKTDLTLIVLANDPNGQYAESSILNFIDTCKKSYQKLLNENPCILNKNSQKKSKSNILQKASDQLRQCIPTIQKKTLTTELIKTDKGLILSVSIQCDQLGLSQSFQGLKDCVRFYSRSQYQTGTRKGEQLAKNATLTLHFSYNYESQELRLNHVQSGKKIQDAASNSPGISNRERNKGRARKEARAKKESFALDNCF